MTAFTPGERLERLNETAESLKDALLDAVEELNRSDQIPSEVTQRLNGEITRMWRVRDEIRPTDFDREQLAGAFKALLDMRDLLDRGNGAQDLDTLDDLLLAVERFRHVIRDALDERVPGLDEATAIVVEHVKRWLPGIPKTAIAKLLEVDVRTLTRWQKKGGPPPHRLAIVARLVGILRHSWTPEGVMAWFERPREDLRGRRPVELLDRPELDRPLIDAARAGRSMYAT